MSDDAVRDTNIWLIMPVAGNCIYVVFAACHARLLVGDIINHITRRNDKDSIETPRWIGILAVSCYQCTHNHVISNNYLTCNLFPFDRRFEKLGEPDSCRGSCLSPDHEKSLTSAPLDV